MDLDSFLVSLYVLVDDWWKLDRSSKPPKIGRLALLTDSEVLTLAIFAQWPRCRCSRRSKIGKSLIDGLVEGPVNDAIVHLIVDFAYTLGLKVTAEGVEIDRQVASLRAMRCDLAQGFYLSKPQPREAAGS